MDEHPCGSSEARHDTSSQLLVSTGIAGLDAVLGGGLPRDHAYLVQGNHGVGKTTLGLQFCLAGIQQGQRVLYIATCESEAEIREVVQSHGWSLDGLDIHCHDARDFFQEDSEQSVFHSAEIELPKTIKTLLSAIDRVNPQRLVIDSLSEIRLLAADPRWFRRQVLALKDHLVTRQCTTLLCDDRHEPAEPVQSIVHGVIDLEQLSQDYGPDRRRLRVTKLRGCVFTSGYHDFKICTGGIDVYPRLIAAEHRQWIAPETLSSGLPDLDALFGGGIDRAMSTLLLGPSGTGKSIIAGQLAMAAAQRGERSAVYLFDERVSTLLQRMQGLDVDLAAQCEHGTVELRQIDPTELTPGEFSRAVHQAVAERDVRMVIIDSLTGYFNAMPDERLLILHLHELLSYLSQRGVTTVMVMTQHGLPGTQPHAPFDLSYIADSVLLFHMFEYAGELRKAISVYKRRGGPHERTIHELMFDSRGIRIGETLHEFQGVLTGMPRFAGKALPHVPNHDRTGRPFDEGHC